ncbi:MAG: PDZ domain-containing protein [Dehalococcoidales bacterium]|nr:PDZ domain-containing protein [Dehalococcoidales bacterium]
MVDGRAVIGFNRPLLEQLLAQAGPPRPSLGLKVADASSQAGRIPALAGRYGAYVGGVTPGLPGAAAGILPGDLITAVDGRPIRGADDLRRALSQGDSRHTLTVERNGQSLQRMVSL